MLEFRLGEKKQDAYSPPQTYTHPTPSQFFFPLCVRGQFALPAYIDKQAHKINLGD